MPIFPTIKYSNIQGWIPEEDIDGNDAGTEYLSEMINVDLENGFLKAAPALSTGVIPTNIATAITGEYDLKSMKHFHHSTRGDCSFYVLLDGSIAATHTLKFFIVDSGNTAGLELNIDEQNSNITYTTDPSTINYSIANDQLKINLNCQVTYVGVGNKQPYLNLTLVYLPTVTYRSGVARSAGWYLFPRWLAWTASSSGFLLETSTATNRTQLVESCTDITPESWINGLTGLILESPGSWTIDVPGYSTGVIDFVTMQNIKNIIVNVTMGSTVNGGSVLLDVIDGSSNLLYEKAFSSDGKKYTAVNFEFDVQRFGVGLHAYLLITGDVRVHSITVNAFGSSDYCVIVKNFDGQRGLITLNPAVGILPDLIDAMSLTINHDYIDWRAYSFEIYGQMNEIFWLVAEITINNNWSAGLLDSYQAITWITNENLIDTLTFNYGLGAEIRVDNQRTIYSECAYRNRAYTVNGGYQVFQSHISGNARFQPDSFPYSAADYYGFFEIPRHELAQALAITPLDELIVISYTKAYIYYIQSGQGITYKKTRAINGACGIYSNKSLIRDLDGSSIGGVLGWVDRNGIYAYGGGTDAPIDLTVKGRIKNFFLTNISATYSNTMIGLYNPIKNELWFIALTNYVYIYEIDYGRWKKYNLFPSMNIIEYCGIANNRIYFITDLNAVVYYDYTNTTRLSPTFTTHYISGFVQNGNQGIQLFEDDNKILQEIFIGNKTVDATAGENKIQVTIIYDGLTFSTKPILWLNKLFDKILAPIWIQWKKVKLQFALPSGSTETDAEIREFGFSFSIMEKGLGR